MSHMVMFRSADGKPGYHPTESLEEAISFVEHQRNQGQVPDARIFRMEEIPIAVKTYYKVEVSPVEPAKAAVPQASPVAPPAPAPAAPPAASAAPPASGSARESVTVPSDEGTSSEPMAPSAGGANGARFGRFNRS
ncbi:MAG TPA: hypothetical protein VNA57_11155 [Acidimicrobiales bacterium]|nr:hypothetical protein [Acidimicrobiales bacterium]